MVGGSGVRNYLTDALDSVVHTVTPAGGIENSYAYKPYGGLLSKTGAAAGPSFTWRGAFGYRGTSRAFAEFYVRANTLASMGRWASRDALWPVAPPYCYASSSPVAVSDPFGLGPCSPISCSARTNDCIWNYCDACYRSGPPSPTCQASCDDMANKYYNRCKHTRPPSAGWHPSGKHGIVPPPLPKQGPPNPSPGGPPHPNRPQACPPRDRNYYLNLIDRCTTAGETATRFKNHFNVNACLTQCQQLLPSGCPDDPRCCTRACWLELAEKSNPFQYGPVIGPWK